MNTNPESEKNEPGEGGLPEDSGFDLVAPTGRMKSESDDRPPSDADLPQPQPPLPVPPPAGALEDKKSMSWKGFEEEEEAEPDVVCKMNKDGSAEDMDMTPMVDVTFLLLIFFMITASFTMIRSVDQPEPTTDEPSTMYQEDEQDDLDYIKVEIDQFNTYHITVRSAEEIEAASNLEMQRVIKAAVEDDGPERLVIIAHEESALKKLIAAYSAARILGIDKIEMQTTDKDF